MNIYLLKRPEALPADWDQSNGFVVAAEDERDARLVAEEATAKRDDKEFWVSEFPEVERLGLAKPFTKRGVILEDFHAG